MKYTDIDFFQPGREREVENRKKRIPLYIGTLVIFGIVGLFVFSTLQVRKLNSQNELLSSQLTQADTKVATMQHENENIKNQIIDVDNALNGFQSVNSTNGSGKLNISHKMLEEIIEGTPSEAFYKEVSIKDNVLVLIGYAENTQVIAKIIYNLENGGNITSIGVGGISKDSNGYYNFTIQAVLKE